VREVLEAEAVEESTELGTDEQVDDVRPLPEPVRNRELSAFGGEVGTVAIAAAGGLVAGAATVVAVRAARSVAQPRRRGLRRRRSKDGMPGVLASRSFLIDVHLLDR
jgi:hypothetical protein